MNHTDSEQPYFDMELFLQTAGETRLAGEELEECLALWAEWSRALSRRTVSAGDRTHLAVWLGEEIEKAVDAAWKESPSRGFRLNALAQTMVMCAVHETVPEVEDAGCAPVPASDENLADALRKAGLPTRAAEGLEYARRYAVVTRAPFGGGCEICALQASCPRSGKAGDSFFEIG